MIKSSNSKSRPLKLQKTISIPARFRIKPIILPVRKGLLHKVTVDREIAK